MADFSTANNIKEFNKMFEEYMQWSKKSIAEVINQKLYFVALQAMNMTKKADPSHIKNELMAPSKKYPDKTLGELLVIMQMRRKGKMPKRTKTLNKNMAKYVQRMINTRVNHIQFLRSGWLPAIRKLDYWNRKADNDSITFSRRFAPKKPQGVKQFGKDKGDVRPARLGVYNSNCRGVILNYVGDVGDQRTSTVSPILQEGLNKAIYAEMWGPKGMQWYMEKKWNEKHQRMASRGDFNLA